MNRPGAWNKGQSGNPHGRPSEGNTLTETMKRVFEAEPELKAKLVKIAIEKALTGDVAFAKMVWNYSDGMPMQKTDITTDGQPLNTLHIYKPEKLKDGTGSIS